MIRANIYKFLYAAAGILVLGFLAFIYTDYLTYTELNNSAPFYAFVLSRATEFLLPAAAAVIVGILAKARYSK